MIKSLFEDFEDNPINQLILSNYGFYPALVFRGTEKFVEKITNLVINYSILGRGEIYEMFDNKNGKYVLCPEERLLMGLKNCFRSEIILNHDLYDIDYKCTIIDGEKDEEETKINLTWDENKVDSLSTDLTAKFWVEKIEKINIFEADSSTPINHEEFELGKLEEIERIKEI